MEDKALQQFALLFALQIDPRRHKRLPTKHRNRDIDDTHSRNGGGRGVHQVFGLEHCFHRWGHRDAVAIGKREQLVVVQDCVQVFNPDGIDRTIEHDPRVLALGLRPFSPQDRKDAIRPIARGWI